jgi:hypothetical protein
MIPRSRPGAAPAALLAVLAFGCAPARVKLPEGPGIPFPTYAEVFADASAACRAVKTLTAEISVSGRVGSQRIRGRALVGSDSAGSLRLEALAPFGAPFFILAVKSEHVMLLFPRDRRLLESERPRDVVEALTGLTLGPADLHAVLSGCLVPGARAVSGRTLEGDWATIDLTSGARAFLRRPDGRWRIVAGQFDGAPDGHDARRVTVEYAGVAFGLPTTVKVWQDAAEGGVAAALTFSLSAVETNAAIDPAAFAVAVPAGVTPMTLEELRQSGPLAGFGTRAR